jgi:hypothetical protein
MPQEGRGPLLRARASCCCEHDADGLATCRAGRREQAALATVSARAGHAPPRTGHRRARGREGRWGRATSANSGQRARPRERMPPRASSPHARRPPRKKTDSAGNRDRRGGETRRKKMLTSTRTGCGRSKSGKLRRGAVLRRGVVRSREKKEMFGT